MTTDIRLMTKTQLKAERLKPALGQRPATRYWQGQGWVYQYDVGLAVAMKPYRAPSEAQGAALAAGRLLAGTEPCASCRQRIDRRDLGRSGYCDDCALRLAREDEEQEWRAICLHAVRLLALEPLFLDTETTGLDAGAEIVEIAVLDRHGAVLFESLVKPVVPVPDEAIAVHGITNEDLAQAPAWPEVATVLDGLVAGRVLVAHNAVFDKRMLSQSSDRHRLPAPTGASWECTLELLTQPNGGRWPNLAVAMGLAGAIRPDPGAGRAHRAAYDAHCCRNIVLALAGAAPPDQPASRNEVGADFVVGSTAVSFAIRKPALPPDL